MMQTWTVEEMWAHEPPCYTKERLIELWAGRESLSVLDILDLDIPATDRMWAVLQAGDHVKPTVEVIVTRAVKTHALPCPTTAEWARKWLSGDDRTYAADAAVVAVVAAAADADADAANAANAAANAAVAAAVAAAVVAAAVAAVAVAAVANAERERQIADVRRIVLELWSPIR